MSTGRTWTGSTGSATLDRAAVATLRLTLVIGGPLNPIGLHECRHTFASLIIAAGVNAKALST